jgi:hypothetical protein
MIQVYNTHIDDSLSQAAALDRFSFFIRSQQLYANTVGIIHCHADFVDDGLLQVISDILPFETVGCTTTSIADDEASVQYGLSLTVLTSDDVFFHTGISGPALKGIDSAMNHLYAEVIGQLPEKPQLIIPYIPFLPTLGGDEFISRLSELSDHSIPFFGTHPISAEADYSRCYTIYNGRAYIDSAVILALSGDAQPRFLTSTIASDEILPVSGTITSAEKNRLISIDNIPTTDFLVNNGLAVPGGFARLSNLQFVIDLPSGERRIRNVITDDGTGALLLTGQIPEFGKISFANINSNIVVSSSRALADAAANAAEGGGMLMYSCIARNWILTNNMLEELEAIRTAVDERSPFGCCYSGGEIYPQFLNDGTVVNTLQNSSLTILFL